MAQGRAASLLRHAPAVLGVALLVGALYVVQRELATLRLDDVLRAMGPSDFAVLPLKGLLIGGVVGAICCAAALGAPWLAAMPTRLIPRGFAYAILGTFIVSGLVSLVL